MRSASPPSCLLVDESLDLLAEQVARPAEVHLEHLTDVHAARNAERVEHDVDRRAVRQVRHVFHRQDAADHALVAVAAGHLVADLQLALDGDVDLHHLDDARRQLVAARELGDLLLVQLFDRGDGLAHAVEHRLDLVASSSPTSIAPRSLRGIGCEHLAR